LFSYCGRGMKSEPVAQHGFLLLADISGYTSFLARSELDHAHEIISDLLDIISSHLTPVFTIAKYEGDAVFAYASSLPRRELVLEAIESTYVAFRNRILAVHRRTTCECNACRGIPTLDLKFILHFGEYIKKIIGGTHDLLGHNVNIVHRLMKNSVTQKTGWRAYVLVSSNAAQEIGIIPVDHMCQTVEAYEHVEPVQTLSYNIHQRYDEITTERKVLRQIGKPDVMYSFFIHAPASLIWDWLNDPVKRGITDGVTVTFVKKIGGRLKEGATMHCVHGKNSSVEEIVEWKPFSSFAIRHEESFANIFFIHDLIPIEQGTRVDVQIKLIPKFALLKPLSTPLMKIVAKFFKFDVQFGNTKKYSEEEWKMRVEAEPSMPEESVHQ
jgi:class 3 adenylate cyclase